MTAELAYHWHGAHDDRRAIGASVRAGRAAAAVFAHDEALEHFERAIRLWSRVADPEAETGTDLASLYDSAAASASSAGSVRRAVDLARSAVETGSGARDRSPRRSLGATNGQARLVPLGARRPGRRPGGRRPCARVGWLRLPRDRDRATPYDARHVAVGDGPLSRDRSHGRRDNRSRATLRRRQHRSQRAAGRGRRSGGVRVARRRHRRPPRGTCAVPCRRRRSDRDRHEPAVLRAGPGRPALGGRRADRRGARPAGAHRHAPPLPAVPRHGPGRQLPRARPLGRSRCTLRGRNCPGGRGPGRTLVHRNAGRDPCPARRRGRSH